MAVAFVRQHVGGFSATNGSTLGLSLDSANSNVANNTLVAVIGMDNLSQTTPFVSSIDVPSGETASWVQVAFVDSALSGAGNAVRAEIWAIQTTTAWGGGASVTVTLSGNVTVKTATLVEFSGVGTTVRSGSPGSGTSSGGTPSALIGAANSGDLVLGGGCGEGNQSITGDSDTSNGSWSTVITQAAGSTTASGLNTCFQYKIATASHNQTYNPTFAAAFDSGVCGVSLVPGQTFNVTASATCTTSVTAARSVATLIATTATTTVAAVRQVPRSLGATVTTGSTVMRRVGRLVGATAVTTSSIRRGVGKTLRATATTSVGVTFGRAYSVVVSATVNTAVSLRRSVQRIAATTVTTSTSVQRLISRRIGATVTTGVSVSAVYQKMRRAAYRVWTATTDAFVSRTSRSHGLSTHTSSDTGLEI